MAKDPDDLVSQLCTRAAMIMEDVHTSALTIGTSSGPERAVRLQELNLASNRIRRLIEAAIALDAS